MTTTDAPPPTSRPDTPLAARISDAVKIYGSGPTAVRALDGVTLDFPSGQFTAVMGPSGSGKSTLMHCLAGLDRLSEGTVQVGDDRLDSFKDRELTKLRRRRIGFVFQAFNLVPTLDARENIELPLRLDGRRVDAEWMQEVVGRLGIADRLDHRPAELSGGQQQRVAVARALITRPAVIFADEPTGNLDTTSSAQMLDLLRSAVHDFGQTIVMVTHDATAAAVADRVLFLVDGRVVRELHEPSADAIYDVMKSLDAAPDAS